MTMLQALRRLSIPRASVNPDALASQTTFQRARRPATVAAAALVISAMVTGCTAADAPETGPTGGYQSEDGTVVQWDEDDRGEPVEFAGDTESGSRVDQDDFQGEIVVVNFWYAACAPCRKEAPDLKALYDDYSGKGVSFLGVNVRDQVGTAQSFSDEFGIEYPSIIDTNTKDVQLAFAGRAAPNAVPTTLILDAKGRVAVRILGIIASRALVETFIDELLEESAQ